MSSNFEGIKKQKFGVEIECTGLTRAAAAKAAQKVLGGRLDHFGGFYDSYHVWDSKNRKWQFMSDASIRCTKKDGTPASKLHSVEVVTPVLEYEDIPLLQEVVRAVRKKGGVCNESTGIHIHIDGAPYDAKKIRNLVNIFASKEDMLYKALMVNSRRETYCEKSEKRFVEQMNKVKPKDMETVKRLWYGDSREHNGHYDPSRYRCLNLHSLFQHNNFEVRAFNSSLNAGVLRAYLSLVLAVSNQALIQKSASPRVTHSENPKYTFRCWLIRIGLNGEEFKNCRKHLLSHLEGNCAWLHPEDAIKQRERLKAEREAARAEQRADVSAVEPTGDTVTEEQTPTAEDELVNVFANEEYEEDTDMAMAM